MALAELPVLNRRTAGGPPGTLLPEPLVLGTCLREVRIALLPPHEQPSPVDADTAGYERYAGAEAYRFLLQLACGLESEIAGETEILGQIKQAWRDYEASHPDHAKTMRPWIQRLLQDTKEIRSEYVVSLGSATYGSLVRRLLGGALPGPTLLIGAGQLAETSTAAKCWCGTAAANAPRRCCRASARRR
jgi:glutamyl-tRNA reductase